MPDLKLDKNLQPTFTDKGDYETIADEEVSQQIIRLSIKDRLHNVFTKYRTNDIQNKILLEINRLAKEKDFINTIEDVSISEVDSDVKGSGFKVNISYNQSENYTEIVDGL